MFANADASAFAIRKLDLRALMENTNGLCATAVLKQSRRPCLWRFRSELEMQMLESVLSTTSFIEMRMWSGLLGSARRQSYGLGGG
jgi:hypothetical protein